MKERTHVASSNVLEDISIDVRSSGLAKKPTQVSGKGLPQSLRVR